MGREHRKQKTNTHTGECKWARGMAAKQTATTRTKQAIIAEADDENKNHAKNKIE